VITDLDRHDVMAWRGLDAAVMAELDEVAAVALTNGHQVARYTEAVRSRARCLELRTEHGLNVYQKLRS
jgi:hypothetical protein